MRALLKAVKDSRDSIWERIYLSDRFDPIYELYRKPFIWYDKVERFFYYGKVGASQCMDFNANSIHDLIYAHMKRVHKFMNSDKTSCQWNDNPNTKRMRKLAEFTELSKRMAENEMRSYVNYNKVKEKYPANETVDIFRRSGDPVYKKDVRRAFKLDGKVTEERLKRYYYLLEKDVGSFWD